MDDEEDVGGAHSSTSFTSTSSTPPPLPPTSVPRIFPLRSVAYPSAPPATPSTAAAAGDGVGVGIGLGVLGPSGTDLNISLGTNGPNGSRTTTTTMERDDGALPPTTRRLGNVEGSDVLGLARKRPSVDISACSGDGDGQPVGDGDGDVDGDGDGESMSVRGGSRSGFGMDVDGDTQDGVDDGEGEGEGTKPVLPLWGDRRPSAPLQSVTPAGFPVTRRFEHAPSMDQDGVPGGGGHFVITGREGQLERCEDEPLTTPQAVQAFGVLIAFDVYDDASADTSSTDSLYSSAIHDHPQLRMVVKQISENSGAVLGISPSIWLTAPCLSHVLPPSAILDLSEALQTLDERDARPTNRDLTPVSFLLDAPSWGSAHAAIHRPSRATQPHRVVLELELVDDTKNPLMTPWEPAGEPPRPIHGKAGLASCDEIEPTPEDLDKSTKLSSEPLRELQRWRRGLAMQARHEAAGSAGHEGTIPPARAKHRELDVLGLMHDVNEQLGRENDLEQFVKVVASIFKELTEFTRIMVYQFDPNYAGRVVAEVVDWQRTKDLYLNLNFPATDIPPQARELYRINKVRLLYDRDQPTARMCCRNLDEVDNPIDQTHCVIRAMSPIHLKYLANMGVRATMSVTITAFGDLWGLVAMHVYGPHGQRVSPAMRSLCRLLGEAVSLNIERLSYRQRLHARKLVNTAMTETNPSGYIVAKASDLLELLDADFGALVVGNETKILGDVPNSQELLAVVEHFRRHPSAAITSSSNIAGDYASIDYSPGFSDIAGFLCCPLSPAGRDFVIFLRRSQTQEVHWAGNPRKKSESGPGSLEPRASFKIWSETIGGRCRTWTDDQLETGAILSVLYSRFIAVWREKESAVAATRLTNLLLTNASHEVRTPLNAIINYLELALDGQVGGEVRDSLSRSYAASKSLVLVINDLLDLTRTSASNELHLEEPLNLLQLLDEAMSIHKAEAQRRGLTFEVTESPSGTPLTVLGDKAQLKRVLSNLIANAVAYTREGGISITWGEIEDEGDLESVRVSKMHGLRLGVSVRDTGIGMSSEQLEAIFRDIEEVDKPESTSAIDDEEPTHGLGLGLAVVARVTRNLDGQLRIESELGHGTTATVIFPLRLPGSNYATSSAGSVTSSADLAMPLQVSAPPAQHGAVRRESVASRSEIDMLVAAISHSPAAQQSNCSTPSSMDLRNEGSRLAIAANVHDKLIGNTPGPHVRRQHSPAPPAARGAVHLPDTHVPLRPVKVADFSPNLPVSPRLSGSPSIGSPKSANAASLNSMPPPSVSSAAAAQRKWANANATRKAADLPQVPPMRVLIVEDELVNRQILQKRLEKDGHTCVVAEHGGDAMRLLESDPGFDLVLMDLLMPIKDGWQTTRAIREREMKGLYSNRPSTMLNGRLPVIAVSASIDEHHRPSLEQAGLCGFLNKPVSFQRLREIMLGVVDADGRKKTLYEVGLFQRGGWLRDVSTQSSSNTSVGVGA